MNKNTYDRQKWNDVFSKSLIGNYFVRRSYQEQVLSISHLAARDTSYYYNGTMVGYAGESNTFYFLDGSCYHISGVFYRTEGWTNGVWIYGRKVLRYLIYKLGIPQPRRFTDENDIPSLKELERQVKAEKRARKNELALLDAVRNGSRASVIKLLEKGVNVNAAYKDRYTPLIWAAYRGHTEIVRLLLAYGADTEAVASHGETALGLAESYGHEEIACLIRDRLINRERGD